MTLNDLTEFIRLYGPTVALGATWAGIVYLWWQRRRAWTHKYFLSHVNFSLNYLQDGTLAMRTLLEMPGEEVWLNEHGVELVNAASLKTTVEQPFIQLWEIKDQEFIQRAVLNALSQRYAEGYLAASLGLSVARDQYVFGITCEKQGEIRTLKVRVLIIREPTLIELFGPSRQADSVELPTPWLRARMQTLQTMYQHYLDDQNRANNALGRIELVLPRVS
jgi:hypothetical protein